MRERFPLLCLFPLRVLVGMILVLAGYHKFLDGWLHGTVLMTILDGWMRDHKSYHFILPVVSTAHAHPKIFGALVTMGEMVIGAAMVLGLFTRLFSLLGTLVFFTFAFASGEHLSPPGLAIVMGTIFFTFLLVPPGRALGLDQVLRTKLPAWLA